jgi:hypothetical protein
MKTKKKTKNLRLRSALKTFKFWFGVLLTTEYMNDQEHRKEFADAIADVKANCKKNKKES